MQCKYEECLSMVNSVLFGFHFQRLIHFEQILLSAWLVFDIYLYLYRYKYRYRYRDIDIDIVTVGELIQQHFRYLFYSAVLLCCTCNTCWVSCLTLAISSSTVLSGLCSNDCPEGVKVRYCALFFHFSNDDIEKVLCSYMSDHRYICLSIALICVHHHPPEVAVFQYSIAGREMVQLLAKLYISAEHQLYI